MFQTQSTPVATTHQLSLSSSDLSQNIYSRTPSPLAASCQECQAAVQLSWRSWRRLPTWSRFPATAGGPWSFLQQCNQWTRYLIWRRNQCQLRTWWPLVPSSTEFPPSCCNHVCGSKHHQFASSNQNQLVSLHRHLRRGCCHLWCRGGWCPLCGGTGRPGGSAWSTSERCEGEQSWDAWRSGSLFLPWRAP